MGSTQDVRDLGSRLCASIIKWKWGGLIQPHSFEVCKMNATVLGMGFHSSQQLLGSRAFKFTNVNCNWQHVLSNSLLTWCGQERLPLTKALLKWSWNIERIEFGPVQAIFGSGAIDATFRTSCFRCPVWVFFVLGELKVSPRFPFHHPKEGLLPCSRVLTTTLTNLRRFLDAVIIVFVIIW